MSPITDADQITTPTLILHDTRCPIATSYALYHALKDNSDRVKFIATLVSGHEPDPYPAQLSTE